MFAVISSNFCLFWSSFSFICYWLYWGDFWENCESEEENWECSSRIVVGGRRGWNLTWVEVERESSRSVWKDTVSSTHESSMILRLLSGAFLVWLEFSSSQDNSLMLSLRYGFLVEVFLCGLLCSLIILPSIFILQDEANAFIVSLILPAGRTCSGLAKVALIFMRDANNR